MTTNMRILIVNDEPLARVALQNVLASRSGDGLCDSAVDAVEALNKSGQDSSDVLLLDVRMPELSGVELLDRLKAADQCVPLVVFVTAHEKYATTAFAKHAVDYVPKPFSNERINDPLDLAFRRTATERLAKLTEILPDSREISQGQAARIAIKVDGRILFIEPNDVVAVHAEGNYVLLQGEVGSHLLRESIAVMAERLKPYGFIRIHRSVLVNSSFVKEIQPCTTGEYRLLLKGGKEFTVTRTYKNNLKQIAALWIGVDGFASQ